MGFLDWAVMLIYIIGLLVLGRHLGKGQKDAEEYYLTGRNIPWWAISVSIMATQLGIISFISAPAFVGVRPQGGLIWLGYEFAVPIAVIFIMILVIPQLYRGGIISIYEYLEKRYDRDTRTIVSLLFQIGRALATGVSVYTAALLLEVVVDLPIWVTILIIGMVTLIYDTMGGMKAVIWSDVIQMGVLLFGILACAITAYIMIGGWSGLELLPRERFQAIDFKGHGFGDGNDFGFWPLLIGGFFLYASYYGCDQSQAQRQISARNLDEAKKSLMLNGFVRYIVVLTYCIMGLLIASFALSNPNFGSFISEGDYDKMVPLFVLHYLPEGLTGIIVVGMVAAVMSNLDSSINSLSAATMRDIYEPYFHGLAAKQRQLLLCKGFTVFWGIFCTIFAFFVGNISPTVIEAINKVGSLFYGPIFAAFIMAIHVKRSRAIGVKVGVIAGILGNVVLWVWFPEISWLWWNAIGFIATFSVGYLLSLIFQGSPTKHVDVRQETANIKWVPVYVLLLLYFVGIILLSWGIHYVL